MISISTLLLRIKEDFHIELNEPSKITFLYSNGKVLQNAKSLGCWTALLRNNSNRNEPSTAFDTVVTSVYDLAGLTIAVQSTDMDNISAVALSQPINQAPNTLDSKHTTDKISTTEHNKIQQYVNMLDLIQSQQGMVDSTTSTKINLKDRSSNKNKR